MVKKLRCEYLLNPLGIDVVEPRLSWILESGERGQMQSAYQVLVASSEENLKKNQGDLWDNGKVESDQSIHVVYEGKPLKSRMRCYWKVRVWDRDGKVSAWSKPAFWSMGLLKASDWKAKWIGLDRAVAVQHNNLKGSQWIWFAEGNPAENAPVGTRYFRRPVMLPEDRNIKKASCLITADNEFILFVNGKKTGAGNYHYLSKFYEFDLTENLHTGTNILAVAATNKGTADNPAGFIAAFQVEFTQADALVIKTDRQWQVFDKETAGWRDYGFDDSGWVAAQQLGECGIAPWGDISRPPNTRLPARMLRHEFQVAKKVKRATAYVCGLGFFELYLNGKKIGDHIMDPGLTEYTKRVFYVTFDVTAHLTRGTNAVGIILGNGRFFAPRTSAHVGTRSFGYPKLLLQMHIEYADGTASDVVSGERWKLTTNGPICANNEYDGEEYDARMEQDGWSEAGFRDFDWENAHLVEEPGGAVVSQMLEPIRVIETIRPVAITNPKPGIYLVDMGRAFYGMTRIKVSGPAGTRVQMRSAYSLKSDGLLRTEDNRGALCTDVYILKGKGIETWQPRFKGQGYRFVEVTGFPGVPERDNFEGLVVHTDMENVGSFACSNRLINQIYSNVRWGQRMYRRSIPSEPDRDERQGWLGDPAKDSESDAYNFNVAAFYTKWLADIRLDQRPDGELPDVSPTYYPFYNGSIVWPSVITIIPEWHHNFYADKRILQENYKCMKRWMVFYQNRHQNPDFTISHNNYGDWCDASTMDQADSMQPGGSIPFGATSRPLISTAYHYNNCKIMVRVARILGKANDEAYFADLAEKVKAAFNRRFFNSQTNKYESETQCSYVLPLAFGLVPQESRAAVTANLIDDIMVKHKGHLSVGMVGMQWLMQTLSNTGHPEVAYTIATQTTRPSWGYMISKGATTVWERWDTDTAGLGMNSEALLILSGNLEAWFYQTPAGINYDPERPGFKHIILRPQPVGDLSGAKANHNSIHGTIESDWRIEDGSFHLSITIPANTTATVYVPAKRVQDVTEGGRPAARSEGIEFLKMEASSAVFAVGSGQYQFRARLSARPRARRGT